MGPEPEFHRRLERILGAESGGLSEFLLLRRLQAQDPEAFPAGLFKDSLSLFRAHFLLFHALYRLRDRLLRERRGLLEIHVLNIRLHPYRESSESGLAHADPMRAYYLDPANLGAMDADELERLLGRFWSRYHADAQRTEALAVLGLEAPVDPETVIRRYRQLAMRHHPDRGGDPARFRAIREAMEILRRAQPGRPSTRPFSNIGP